jgi:DNA-binding PadR family transcriptional regulator
LPPTRRLTDFEQILIGLIVAGRSSGYDLKRFFISTPAVVHEPSSGAIYPALRRLEHRGLLRSELALSAGKREQRRYHATEAGDEVGGVVPRYIGGKDLVARDVHGGHQGLP